MGPKGRRTLVATRRPDRLGTAAERRGLPAGRYLVLDQRRLAVPGGRAGDRLSRSVLARSRRRTSTQRNDALVSARRGPVLSALAPARHWRVAGRRVVGPTAVRTSLPAIVGRTDPAAVPGGEMATAPRRVADAIFPRPDLPSGDAQTIVMVASAAGRRGRTATRVLAVATRTSTRGRTGSALRAVRNPMGGRRSHRYRRTPTPVCSIPACVRSCDH